MRTADDIEQNAFASAFGNLAYGIEKVLEGASSLAGLCPHNELVQSLTRRMIEGLPSSYDKLEAHFTSPSAEALPPESGEAHEPSVSAQPPAALDES